MIAAIYVPKLLLAYNLLSKKSQAYIYEGRELSGGYLILSDEGRYVSSRKPCSLL